MISLDFLPPDILFNIFAELICPLVSWDFARTPQTEDELDDADELKSELTRRSCLFNHPFLALSEQNRALRAAVECLCDHLLRKRLLIVDTKIRDPKYEDWSAMVAKAGKKASTEKTTYRMQYLTWSFQRCLFCGKRSRRQGMFNLHMWACRKCDRQQLPSLISKSDASKLYGVQETYWRYPHIVFPEAYKRPLTFAVVNLPTCFAATMIYRTEVEELSQYIKIHDPKHQRMCQANVEIHRKPVRDWRTAPFWKIEEQPGLIFWDSQLFND